MRAHGGRLGSRSPRATFSLSPSSRPCPASRAFHNIPRMAPSASQDLQPIAPAMSVALPPSTQHPSLPSSSTPSENNTPIPSGSTSHSSKKPTAKRKRTGGGHPDSDSADGSSTPRTRDGPKKKKANRACFHCQKAHLTCDDCEHLFNTRIPATVRAALQAARVPSCLLPTAVSPLRTCHSHAQRRRPITGYDLASLATSYYRPSVRGGYAHHFQMTRLLMGYTGALSPPPMSIRTARGFAS